MSQGLTAELKVYFLDKSSWATCRLMRKQITREESRQYMQRILKSSITNYGLRGDDIKALNSWTEYKSTMNSLRKLASARLKYGRGSTKCSMDGDNNWLPYVQKTAKES